jgi:hypothetical protein
MPEDPNSPIEPAANPDQAAEWTDESGYEEIESFVDVEQVEDSAPKAATDEWEAADLKWEEDIPETIEEPAAPTTQEALAWLRPTWRKFRASWLRLIAGLRNRIPAAANLSDATISAILIGILGLLLVLFNSVRQPSAAVERSPQAPTAPVERVPDTERQPAEPVPTAIAPTKTPTEASPSPDEAVDIERIAKIQAKLTDSSIYNAQRVVDSVQADFTRNRLTLICNDDWYRLSNYDQNLLANQLKNQSEELSFKGLELQTADGTLIARNPVIGDEMIIFLRERPPAVEPPERPRYRIMIDR